MTTISISRDACEQLHRLAITYTNGHQSTHENYQKDFGSYYDHKAHNLSNELLNAHIAQVAIYAAALKQPGDQITLDKKALSQIQDDLRKAGKAFKDHFQTVRAAKANDRPQPPPAYTPY